MRVSVSLEFEFRVSSRTEHTAQSATSAGYGYGGYFPGSGFGLAVGDGQDLSRYRLRSLMIHPGMELFGAKYTSDWFAKSVP